jgi:hypothetical protein
MVQTLSTRIRGLFTSDNVHSEVPDGALLVADNIVIDRDSIAEPRRGFDRLTASFADADHRGKQIWFYQDKLMAHTSADQLQHWNGTAWTALSGTYSKPANAVRVRAVEANQNLYLTTSAGVFKQDAYSSAPTAAGAYKALDLRASIPGSATAAWLADDERVTYRAVWGYKDANNNLVLGAPSQRETTLNTAGADRDVLIEATIPTGVTTAWFIQLYRSAALPDPTAALENNDELQLVFEMNPTAGSFSSYTKTFLDAGVNTGTETITIASHGFTTGDMVMLSNSGGTLPTGLAAATTYYVVGATTNTLQLSATYGGSAINITAAAGGGTHTILGAQALSILDIVPDELRGALIYTASSQEGIAKGNEQPPLASDIAVFKGHMFYVDTVSKHRFYLTLTAVGSPNGIQADDTLTIGGVAFTGKATESVAAGQFDVVTGGSAAQNIRDTALSLVRVINRYASSTVYAYYLSGVNELPGKILIEERSIGGASFPVISSRSTCWNPALPTSGTTQSSENDQDPAGVSWSKSGQPEAVPLPHKAPPVGSKTKRTLRAVPLRDSLFLFKQDGLYRVTGDSADNFRVELFDSSTRLLAPESCAVLANQIFCYTDQGVCMVSETGVSIVSEPIKKDLLRILGVSQAGVKNYCFGVAYDTDHRYILWTITTAADTYATQAFVYNEITTTWTRWDLPKRCGVVSPVEGDDKLYLGDAESAFVNKERKAYDSTDIADFAFSSTITTISVDFLTLTLSSGVDEIQVGDVIYQSATVFGIVSAVDSLLGEVVVESPAEWTVAACDVFAAIDTAVTWSPVTGGNPGILHQFHTAVFLFETDFAGTSTLAFKTDLEPSEYEVPLTGSATGRWGFDPWGDGPWGGEALKIARETWVPKETQLGSQHTVSFRHRVGFSSWELAGMSLHGNNASERIGR